MNRKLVSLCVLTVLLVLTFSTPLGVRKVEASGTIYIRADGSIDPLAAPISTVDNVTYTLMGNITSDVDGIVVERSNIIIDGAGYTVQGTGNGRGLDLSGISNVTVKNTTVKSFQDGIYIYSSTDLGISDNTITANNGYGMWLGDSSGITVSGNEMTENEWGIQLYWTQNSTLSDNNLTNNQYNFALDGGSLSDYIQNIDLSNTVNGKPVYYWINRHNDLVPSDVGYVALVNCTNLTVKKLNLTKNGQGVLLAYTSNSTITENNIRNNWDGVHLHESSNNTISTNDITLNWNGIFLNMVSSYNTLYGNNVTDNDGEGICLWNHSTYNNVYGNNVAANSATGIELDSSNNNVHQNNMTNNHDGIYLYESHNNLLTDNTVKGNTEYGIFLWNSGNNTLTLNDLTGNWLDFGVNAEYLDGFYQSIDSLNLVNGKPIYYLMDLENTIITPEGYPNIGYMALINGNSAVIENISLQDVEGLELVYSKNCSVKNLNVENCTFAVYLLNSDNNTVSNVTVSNGYVGILYFNSTNNSLFENALNGNEYGIMSYNSHGNSIYHNNLLNNSQQVRSEQSINIWDYGYPSGGNYWSDYNGIDANHDGIGDSNYTIDADNNDRHPLMGMFHSFNVSWIDSGHTVDLISNSTISAFDVGFWIEHPENRVIKFNATGETGTAGFCRICIPTALLNATYTVLLNGTEIPCTLLPCSNSTHSYLYFNYTHSTEEVTIIREFPSFFILPLCIAATLLTTAICRRRKRVFPKSAVSAG
jgi:parallel beta-helix repeat protein